MAKLTDEQRQEIKQLLAWNHPASKIVDYLRREYYIEITVCDVNQMALWCKLEIEKIRLDLDRLICEKIYGETYRRTTSGS